MEPLFEEDKGTLAAGNRGYRFQGSNVMHRIELCPSLNRNGLELNSNVYAGRP